MSSKTMMFLLSTAFLDFKIEIPEFHSQNGNIQMLNKVELLQKVDVWDCK